MGFGVWCLRLGIWDLGFELWGLFEDLGVRFTVLGVGVWRSFYWGLGFQVSGF